MSLRIGSLFTGTGALDLAVMDVFDAEVVWHSQYEPPNKNGKEDKNQYAARILARHWPTVPNLGDVTAIDWPSVIREHGPVDILTGGFPCQDVSSAGKRAGLTADSRSGLWAHMARAIHELRPRLVVIENVEGLLSAKADRGLGLDAEALEREARAGRVLRALGAVLGDLATLGFDAEWCRVAASEVGAPHPRKRVFIYAWPAALHPGDIGRRDGQGILGRLGTAGRDAEATTDSADVGYERCGIARDRRPGPADGDLAPAHSGSPGLEVGGVESHRHELPATERGRRQPAAHAQGAGLQGLRPQSAGGGSERGGTPAADPRGVEPERRGVAGVLGSEASAEPGEGDQRERAGHAPGDSGEAAADTDGRGREGHKERHGGTEAGQPEGERGLDADGRGVRRATVEPSEEAPADTACLGRGEGRPEPAGVEGGSDAAERGSAAPADADNSGQRADVLNLRPGQPDLDWGDYGPAIRRWEHILGRPAPWPTDALGRLSPVFTEWLMGLPDGWVTDTPGLTRSAMLRALGNGVVRLQAATAIRLLATRATDDATSRQAA